MLGKLIKHEFVNRGKLILGLIGILCGTAVLECIVGAIYEASEHDGGFLQVDFIDTLYTTVTITFVAAFIGSIVAIIILSFLDYNSRFFKNQGYLTHTLPVKTSSLLLAKGIVDILIGLVMFLVYPFTICIAFRDFSIYGEMFDFLSEMMSIMVDDGQLAVILILLILNIFIGLILTNWHYYAAYALGHCYFKKKRSMSVLMYIALYMVGQTISSLFIALVAAMPEDEFLILLTVSGAGVLSNLIMLIICFAITHEAITKRLDLE